MRISVLLSVITMSVAGNAQADGLTAFDDLANKFNQGSLPSVAEISGWHVGRCYTTFTPSNAMGSLLWEEPTGGPMYPEQIKFGNLNDNDATRYDDLHWGDKTDFKNEISKTIGWQKAAVIMNGTIMDEDEDKSGPSYRLYLRKSGEFLVERVDCLDRYVSERCKTPDYYSFVGILEYCYFFKKVQ